MPRQLAFGKRRSHCRARLFLGVVWASWHLLLDLLLLAQTEFRRLAVWEGRKVLVQELLVGLLVYFVAKETSSAELGKRR